MRLRTGSCLRASHARIVKLPGSSRSHVGAILALARRVLRDMPRPRTWPRATLLRLWRAGETLDLGSHGLRPWLEACGVEPVHPQVRGSKRTVVVDELPEVADPPRQMAGL